MTEAVCDGAWRAEMTAITVDSVLVLDAAQLYTACNVIGAVDRSKDDAGRTVNGDDYGQSADVVLAVDDCRQLGIAGVDAGRG